MFYERYELVKNPIDTNASFDGCGIETYGGELEYIKELIGKEQGNCIWTVIDDNAGWYGVVAGVHLVNRQLYLVTTEPWQDINEEYTISDESEVNEWFGLAGFDILENEFGVKLWGLDEDATQEALDKVSDMWHDKSIDEREDIMNKHKHLGNDRKTTTE